MFSIELETNWASSTIGIEICGVCGCVFSQLGSKPAPEAAANVCLYLWNAAGQIVRSIMNF